ncbi:MAG TPA: hypothetical protein ENI90_06970 [Methylothermaceae bacterium]|nr:hypothetical protein [Methylothermaceae bacterium]
MSNENENPTTPGEEEGKAPTEEQPTEAPKEEAGAEEAAAPSALAEKLTALRQEKPMLFYGGIAGILLVLFLVIKMFGGGGVEQAKVPTIQVGQTYKLVNPNVTGGGDVLLFQAPGRMGATDPEIREKEKVCVVKAGTPAKVLEQSVVNYVKYVKVEPVEGDCAGKQGWTSIVNLKAQ